MSGTIMQTEHIQNLIFTIRGVPVMLDRDLAVVYRVETKVLNQAVKRNIARFPQEFRFQINEEERDELVTICDRFEPLKHSTVNPYAFTEQGVSMLSGVLRSDTAVKVSILCTIYIKTISRQLALDLKKHNQQYPQIALKSFPDAHDRFLLIDGVEIYHIGASLKDLGKKWFAFSRFETGALEMLNKLEGK